MIGVVLHRGFEAISDDRVGNSELAHGNIDATGIQFPLAQIADESTFNKPSVSRLERQVLVVVKMEPTQRDDVTGGCRRGCLVGNGKQFSLAGVHELFVPLSNIRHFSSGNGSQANLFLLHDVCFIKSITFFAGQALVHRLEQLHPHGPFFQWGHELGDIVQSGFVGGQFAVKSGFLSPDFSLDRLNVLLGIIPLLFAPRRQHTGTADRADTHGQQQPGGTSHSPGFLGADLSIHGNLRRQQCCTNTSSAECLQGKAIGYGKSHDVF